MAGQLTMNLAPRTWGGKRAGAGRKPNRKKGAKDPSHRARPAHVKWKPLHVVLRMRADVPRLRSQRMLDAIRGTMERTKDREDVQIIHMSIQHDHVHLIAEAADSAARTRGIQGFAIAVAKAINAAGRRGKVYRYRYHATEIGSPRQMRNTLAYVLGNWRHHGEHRASRIARTTAFDPYSSAARFDGWAIDSSTAFDAGLPVQRPTRWLLTTGWRKHAPLDPWAIPG